MPGGKRAGAGRPKGSGYSPTRTTGAAAAIKARRAEFVSMVPAWGKDIDLHSGVYPVRLVDLHLAFSEWIEAREPGHGAAVMQIFTPYAWSDAFKKAFPRVRKRANGFKNEVFLSQVIVPTTPRPEYRYGVCPCCSQSCRIDAHTNMPVTVKTEDLVDLLKRLRTEVQEERGTDAEIVPANPSTAYRK